MKFSDVLSLSYGNLKGNKLSTGITIVIMALGIFALILIITAVAALSEGLNQSFASMGANAFSLRHQSINYFQKRNSSPEVTDNRTLRSRKSNLAKPITFEEAIAFKERYNFPDAKVSVAILGARNVVVNIGSIKTNPEVTVFGGDENYLDLNGYDMLAGRNITIAEVESGANVCLLGYGVFETLFKDNADKCLESVVNIDHKPYRVVGILKDKTASAFFNAKKIVITSYNNVRRLYQVPAASYTLAVQVANPSQMDNAIGEAQAVMRPIRKLDVKDENNFYVDKSDSAANSFFKNIAFIQVATVGIALITLFCAAIGLMNIMLVKVKERTKEIGLAKALGSTSSDIRKQFLYESILISLFGALFGIVSGVLLGNVLAIFLKTGFVVPWNWVGIAIVTCSVVGLVAGLYPAYKASKLDPIVALRYE